VNNASDDTIGFGQLVAVLRCASPTDDSVANFLEIICKIKCTIHLEKKKRKQEKKSKGKKWLWHTSRTHVLLEKKNRYFLASPNTAGDTLLPFFI
jgi:hypothetical protein